MTIRKILGLSACLALLMLPNLAQAQFSASYNFLKAVRERDGTKATEIISKPGTVIIDTHDSSTGETALHILIKERDLTWLNFMLSKGARPDLKDNRGDTPLMIAAQINFVEGAQLLINNRASVDITNGSGETPLIRAVQKRDAAMVNLLLTAGASPAKTDSIAGLSARDYATRDPRAANILKLITDTKPRRPAKAMGPS